MASIVLLRPTEHWVIEVDVCRVSMHVEVEDSLRVRHRVRNVEDLICFGCRKSDIIENCVITRVTDCDLEIEGLRLVYIVLQFALNSNIVDSNVREGLRV